MTGEAWQLPCDHDYSVKLNADETVTLQEEGCSDVVYMSVADALQVAYALMTVCAGQGPSLVRVHRGRRERVD